MKTTKLGVDVPHDEIEKFCRKWKIRELAVFGSVLRADFDPDKSDIDVLYSFLPGASVGWDIFRMKEDLEAIFKHRVDILRKEVIQKSRNPYRKEAILSSYEVIYERASRSWVPFRHREFRAGDDDVCQR